MTAQSFQCPSCGAPLIPRKKASTISCPHCHMSVVVPEELRQVSDEAQWTTLVADNFVSNDHNWPAGTLPSEYFTELNRTIADGRYRWEVQTGRANSIAPAWLMAYEVADFHLIAHCKHISGSKAGSGWCLIFKIKDNQNYYSFRITDQQFFAVSFQKDSQWQNLVEWTRTDTVKPNGVNQLEVIARETSFTFLINGQVVHELDHGHFRKGLVGLAVEGYTPGEKAVYDFIDITLRAPRGE
jgi:predicted RNA-binding Zn-ribbon protein involved in translation (DUF1610 family)